MNQMLSFDEFICQKFDNFRATINNDSAWLSLFTLLISLCLGNAFWNAGLIGVVVWVLVSAQYLFWLGWWKAAKSKESYNIKRDQSNGLLRLSLLIFSLVGIILGSATVLIFSIALYVASAHKLPPKKREPKLVLATLQA
jgi:hypothetical protein